MSNLGRVILDSSRAADRDFTSWSAPLGPPTQRLQCDHNTLTTTLTSQNGHERTWPDPIDALLWMSQTIHAQGASGRWVGYLGYDLGRLFETLPSRAVDDLRLPLFIFTWHDRVGEPEPAPRYRTSEADFRSTFSRESYLGAVNRILRYIADGDVFQVNLAQRFTAALRDQPELIWQRLRERSPALYGAYLAYDDFALISNSPELFLRVDGRRIVTTRPIKGTRPRTPGMEVQLRESAKDQAELNMIVDVERNDLGRVCEIGSVKVVAPRVIESHPTVYHAAATIEGTLREGVNFVHLLRATFPTGSITGAPKIRAMEIIDELEPVRRAPYCGAIGYLDSDGRIEFNVTIRTMIVKDGLVHVPVGGGIVADSDPHAEYEETLVKAQAMFDALEIVAQPPSAVFG